MKHVHLVYPHEQRISCPDAIGRNLSEHLRSRYEVHLYDWDSNQVIHPEQDDILLGHPHPSPRTTFRRSLPSKGWSRRLILAPYNHGDPRQSAWLSGIVQECDLFLAITGEYWMKTASSSSFAHWLPKMVQMDLAVDRNDFPAVKTDFNAPGRRRFLFIGHSRWTKNVDYLSRIAQRIGSDAVSWMGVGRAIPWTKPLGFQDFRETQALELVAEHDFLLSVGRADANPAVVLEAMAWGLIPACSKESAHADLPGIVEVPLDDVDGAVRVLNDLQTTDATTLHQMQQENWSILDERFTWGAFAERAIDAIESSRSPDLLPMDPKDRRVLARARLRSPYAWWRPTQLRDQLRRSLRGV